MISIQQKQRILKNHWLLSYYDLDERDQLWALEYDLFPYLKNPSESVCKKAIIKSPDNIKFIKNPSKDLQKECFLRDSYCIHYVDNCDEGVIAEVLKINPDIIGAVKNVSRTLILLYFHLQPNINKQVLESILQSNPPDDVADIIVKELYKHDEDMLSEWKFLSRKAKLEKLLK